MLHLFNKVYVEFDTKLSIDHDRIVISDTVGVPMFDALDKVSGGELLAYGLTYDDVVGENATFSTFVDMLQSVSSHVTKTGKPTIIFVDDAAFLKIVTTWFKMVLPHAKATDVYNIIKTFIFKEEMFSNSKFSLSSVQADFEKASFVSAKEFEKAYNSVEVDSDESAFVEQIKSSVSIEFLLASYLFDGSYKDELKNIMRVLLAKDLEKYLYELKEILLVHILHPQLQEKLGMSKKYTLDNLDEIAKDKSPLVKVLFKPEIWTKKGLSTPTSTGSINFAGFTTKDIESVREYGKAVGEVWEEEKFYTIIKSDIMKLDFIPFVSKDQMSDGDLEKVIAFETAKEHAAGSYNSIDIGTVNNYLVDYIIFMYNKGDVGGIKPFTL